MARGRLASSSKSHGLKPQSHSLELQKKVDEDVRKIRVRHDKETEKMKLRDSREIQELALRRNALSPVSRLSPTILSMIFAFFASDKASHVICPLTHVCHNWRVAALECPYLWCNIIPVSDPERTSEILKRSRNAPLRLSLVSVSRRRPYPAVNARLHAARWKAHVNEINGNWEAISIALDHIARVRSLHLDIHGECFLKSDAPGLNKHAPLLETLQLDKAGALLSHKAELFGGQTPRLRSAALRGFDFAHPGNASFFKDLTSLELSEPVKRPTFPQMHSLLESTPLLETLKLHHAVLPDTEALSQYVVTVIHLDNLHCLEIDDRPIACTSFMASLKSVQRPRLILHFDDRRTYIQPDQLSIINSFTTRMNSMPFLSARILSPSIYKYRFDAWTSFEPERGVPVANPDLSITTDRRQDELFQRLPLAHLRSLDRVRMLHVDSNCVREVLKALTAHLLPEPNSELQPFLPVLDRLFLEDIDFSSEKEHEVHLPSVLRAFLEDRHKRNSPLAELHIIGCRGVEEDILHWKVCVRMVAWKDRTPQVVKREVNSGPAIKGSHAVQRLYTAALGEGGWSDENGGGGDDSDKPEDDEKDEKDRMSE